MTGKNNALRVDVPSLFCMERAARSDAANVEPSLTNNEHARFDMASAPITRPSWDSQYKCRTEATTGYVYFVAPEALLHRDELDEGTQVKIGFTRGNPLVRLSALQTGSPLPLKLWAYVQGSKELESAFHETFAEMRSHGEWFYVSSKLYDFMGYLGEEPHTGNLITREQMAVAIFDCLIPDRPSHPSHDENLWRVSADASHLKAFFPEAFE